MVVLLAGILAGSSGCERGPVPPPNVLLVMADDLGYSDLGSYGGEIATPTLDRLAAEGLRFTQFYSAGRCVPTRASLMTGLYPHQAGMGWLNLLDDPRPGYAGDLSNSTVTLAEVLKAAGYRTYMSGKWQLTHDRYRGQVHDTWPRKRGFDRFYGIIGWTDSYFRPRALASDNTPVETTDADYFLTRALPESAVGFLDEHSATHPDEPFFLYLAFNAPHAPLETTSTRVAELRQDYRAGWDRVGRKRAERMLEMGLIDRSWPLSDRASGVKAWSDLGRGAKRDMVRKMAVYAAQVEEMDRGLAAVVAKLEEMDVLDNTLILFLSDNGAADEGGPMGKKDGDYPTYGMGWAEVSNTPWRDFKGSAYEGGIASPLIVHWPRGLERAGELRHQPAHVIDILATLVELAGAGYPASRGEHPIPPMAGTSLVPAFHDESLPREALFWEHEGSRAVRVGDWKLVADSVGSPWELFDLQRDRTETSDLAAAEPERVAEMAALWQRWAEESQVLPLDGRSWWQRLRPKVAGAKETAARP
jgi:arylsulfatase